MPRSKPYVRMLLLCCSAALLAPAPAPSGWTADHSAGAQEAPPRRGAARAGAEGADGTRAPQLGSRLWWNQERLVASLGLSEEQRKGMDADLAACVEARRAQANRYGELRREMGRLLAAGDWEGARAQAAEANAVLAAMGEAESDMTVAVMRRLSEAQRRQLVESYPRLLNRPWLVGGLGRGLRPRPGAGRAAGSDGGG